MIRSLNRLLGRSTISWRLISYQFCKSAAFTFNKAWGLREIVPIRSQFASAQDAITRCKLLVFVDYFMCYRKTSGNRSSRGGVRICSNEWTACITSPRNGYTLSWSGEICWIRKIRVPLTILANTALRQKVKRCRYQEECETNSSFPVFQFASHSDLKKGSESNLDNG